MPQILICLVIGYLFGSILTASIIMRFLVKKDIRKIGSGNPGMANIMSNIGKKEGFMVLAGDILKVIIACLLSWLITWDMDLNTVILWTGFAAITGHDFPFWRKFQGGKGVAVTCAWLVFFMPLWGSVSCIIGGIITLVTGYLPIGGILIPVIAIPFAFITCGPVPGILVTVSAVLMIQRHWTGLKGIRNGTEKRRFSHKTAPDDLSR